MSLYESKDVQAYWDIAVFEEYNEVRANRVDARIVSREDSDNSGNELPLQLDPESREERQGEAVVVWAPTLGA